MAYKPAVGKNYKTGLQLNREPWIIEEDAFTKLSNAYCWRGRVKKKLGVAQLGRLQRDFVSISIGNTGASPWTFNLFTTSVPAIGATEGNKSIVPGSVQIVFGGITFNDLGQGALVSVTPGNFGSVNYATGSISLTHTAGAGIAATATFSYHPGLPVMGLPDRTLMPINNQQLMAFDTIYSYIWSNTLNRFKEAPSTLPTVWSGNNSQLFWSENAYSALWTTNDVAGLQGYNVTTFASEAVGPPATVQVTTTGDNNLAVGDQVIFINLTGAAAANNGFRGVVTVIGNPVTIENLDGQTWTNAAGVSGVMIVANQNLHGDGIRWYDGNTWINFNPVLNPVTALMGAGIILFYRGRIVVLDTLEGNSLTPSATRFPQRARWSKNGTPFDIGPVPSGSNIGVDYESWREDVVGRGGFIDCPTSEEIVSATFLRDTLIVGFERSKWKLRYTNNELLPFVWERLDVELGDEGRFSGVKFDKFTLGIGSRGITACDGVGVNRLDLIIPDIAFNFSNENSGAERIFGIRDFEEQIVYWTFPNDGTNNGVFPNTVLLYNYLDSSWAMLNDSFTVYGYWENFNDLTWADLKLPSNTWQNSTFTWVSDKNNVEQQQVVAGNQIGFVSKVQWQPANDPTLYVKAVTAGTPGQFTIQDHNLASGDIIQLVGFMGDYAVLAGLILQAQWVDSNTIALYQWNPTDGVYQQFTVGAGTYIGGGLIARVDNFQILSKKFNPIIDQAISVMIKQIDFYVEATANGRFAVDLYVSDQNESAANPPDLIDSTNPLANPLSNRVETFANPYEIQGQDKYWHSLYNTVTGNLFQASIYYGDQELNDPTIFSNAVVIHSIAPQSQPASSRLT